MQQVQPVQYVVGAPTQQPMAVQHMALSEAQQDMEGLKSLKNSAYPETVFCPMCGHRGPTDVEKVNGISAHGACMGLFAMGFQAGCCLIPYCVDDLKDVVHKCNRCNHVLGRKACIN